MKVKLHYRALLAAFAFGMMGVGITSCTENIDMPDTDSSQDGLTVSVNAVDTQAEALQAYNANPNSQTYADLLAAQGLKETDLVHGTLPAQGSLAEGMMFVESSVPTVNAPEEESQTRGRVANGVNNDFTVTAYRATTPEDVSNADVWIPSVTFDKTGTPKQPFHWSSKMPYARFYAVFPVADAANGISVNAVKGKVPTISFTANTDNTAQNDLMVATSPITQYKGGTSSPAVSLPFRHALTAINFAVGENLDAGKRITKVTISNVYQKGVYQMASDEKGTGAGWTGHSDATTFALEGISVPTDGSVGNILLGDHNNYTFLMVPQVLTGRGVQLRVEFNDNPNDYIEATLNGEWKAGETRTYKLSNKDANWDYQFNVKVEPSTTIFGLNGKVPFSVQSYRVFKGQAATRTPVAWKVVGYQLQNNNGTWGAETTNKPNWINITKTTGNGSIAFETSFVDIAAQAGEVVDVMNEYNTALKTVAPGVTKLGLDKDGKLNTANTYIISHAGRYSLPLVYGNGFKNGNVELKAFSLFKDYQGVDIKDPYIVKAQRPMGRNQVVVNGKSRLKAKVVWSDPEGVIQFDANPQNAFTNGDYSTPARLNFNVDPSKIRSGNAVIAITDDKGTVVWSWQLWFAHEDVLTPVPVKVMNSDSYVHYLLSTPLGWTFTKMRQLKGGGSNGRQVKIILEQTSGPRKRASFVVGQTMLDGDGYTMLYQWGRKDPFPSTNLTGRNHGVNVIYPPKEYKFVIQNPDKFISRTGNSALAPEYFSGNLHHVYWGQSYTSGHLEYHKTIFDPSPAGYRVPDWHAGHFIVPLRGAVSLVKKPGNFRTSGNGNVAFVKTNVNDGWLFAPYHMIRSHGLGRLQSDPDGTSTKPKFTSSWTSTTDNQLNGRAKYFYGSVEEVWHSRTLDLCMGLGLRPMLDLDYNYYGHDNPRRFRP